jgi:hypothetical protein
MFMSTLSKQFLLLPCFVSSQQLEYPHYIATDLSLCLRPSFYTNRLVMVANATPNLPPFFKNHIVLNTNLRELSM